MIIGFTGKIGAGKDTAGAYLVDKYGFTRISFAEKLKQSAAACLGINPGAWEHLKNNPNAYVEIHVFDKPDSFSGTEVASVTVREFLQNYGTEAHRDIFGDDFWVDQGLAGVSYYNDYVVTDVRFQNEAEAIRDRGGIVLQINRNTDSSDTHASEAGIPDYLLDGKIANIGSKEQLYVLLDALIDRVNLAPKPYNPEREEASEL